MRCEGGEDRKKVGEIFVSKILEESEDFLKRGAESGKTFFIKFEELRKLIFLIFFFGFGGGWRNIGNIF